MALHIVRNDITKMEVDAIVNAANESLLGGGGVDGAIHRAAGPKLLKECRTLHGCKTGQAKITGGYHLPAKYVIHTVGPIWQGGMYHEEELLTSCYQRSLELAEANHCESIAFPLISAGVYGYPKAEALHIAVSTISSFLMNHDMDAYIVVFDKKSFQIGEKVFSDIQEYIDDHYVSLHEDVSYASRRRRMQREEALIHSMEMECAACPGSTLEDALSKIDESFSQMLLRKIDEKGMKDSECYHRANVDRRLFSKIRNNVNYKPSKATAIAFAIALKLSLEETRELLEKAGYALTHASRFDIIVEYFIINEQYNIYEINEALFAFDQQLLGA